VAFVNTLVDQIKGKIELKNENGVTYSIKFNSFE
jgi:two-component sensor histidine kinase